MKTKEVKAAIIVLIVMSGLLILASLQPLIKNKFTGYSVSETPPTIPHLFLGEAEYFENSSASLQGCEVTADFNAQSQGVLGYIDSNNFYSAFIETRGQGGQVIFYIGNVQASPVIESQNFETGGSTNTNLTIYNQTTCSALCGNNQINFGEACDTNQFLQQVGCSDYGFELGYITCSDSCTISIGNCYNPPGGGTGGGGGGGSSGGSSGGNNNENNQNQEPPRVYNNRGITFDREEETPQIENQNPQSGFDIRKFGSLFTGAFVGFIKESKGIGIIFLIAIFFLMVEFFIQLRNKIIRKKQQSFTKQVEMKLKKYQKTGKFKV